METAQEGPILKRILAHNTRGIIRPEGGDRWEGSEMNLRSPGQR
jgi:hypothetical protein